MSAALERIPLSPQFYMPPTVSYHFSREVLGVKEWFVVIILRMRNAQLIPCFVDIGWRRTGLQVAVGCCDGLH